MKLAAPASVRLAAETDLPDIRRIYNEGIVDRVATLDEDQKTEAEMGEWWQAHGEPHAAFVAERDGAIVGWAAINRYNNRCAYRGVGDLSVYVAREARGTGVGSVLLAELERGAAERGFHKLVLFTFGFNEAGQRLYRARGFREVGVFRNQGKLDGTYVDVMAMEKMLD